MASQKVTFISTFALLAVPQAVSMETSTKVLPFFALQREFPVKAYSGTESRRNFGRL